MIYLGPPGIPTKSGDMIAFEHVKYIHRTLWQKLFGVKCPSCGVKMGRELSYYPWHSTYSCYSCKYLLKDYGNDNP